MRSASPVVIALLILVITVLTVVIIAMFNSPFLFSDDKKIQRKVCIGGYGLLAVLMSINVFLSSLVSP